MCKVMRKNHAGRCWSRAVDMLEDTFTAQGVSFIEATNTVPLLVVIEYVERLDGATCHDELMVASAIQKLYRGRRQSDLKSVHPIGNSGFKSARSHILPIKIL